nr:hypothetical protein [Tanacetum cinerariifolium]
GFLLSSATDFTNVGPFVLNLCKKTRQNTQPRTAAGEGTNISRAGHTNIVENAQAVCNERINSVCLHTRGRVVVAATAVSVKGALPALSFFGRDRCGNTSGSWIAGAVALPAAGPKDTCSRDGAHIHCYQARRCAKRTGINGLLVVSGSGPAVTSNWAVCCTLNPPLLPPIPPEGVKVPGGYVRLKNIKKMTKSDQNRIKTRSVKEYQENDKIGSKPDKNGKRGEARKS